MKGVDTDDTLRGAGNKHRSGDSRIGQPLRTTHWIHRWVRGNSVNWNILVAEGIESKSDSQSSGERNGNSLNPSFDGGSGKTVLRSVTLCYLCATHRIRIRGADQTKNLDEAAESCTIDGESPVVKSSKQLCFIPSSMGHVESRVNQRGPPRKAKYS
jgi:hypothetical protein